MNYNYEHIISFLNSRGWIEHSNTNLFRLFVPPQDLLLPQDYVLEIPKNSNLSGFDNYIKSLLSVIIDLYEGAYTDDDLNSIFKTKSSILSFRIIDEDTEGGSIKFERFSNSIDSFRKIFSQITTFVTTKKPIFGNADFEVESYLHRCRTLQTQKGSFITKFEITPEPIVTLFNTIIIDDINNRLFEILDFINYEVFKNQQLINIDKSYVESNLNYINIELFNSIKELYFKSKISNAEYNLNNYSLSKYIETRGVLTRINHFNKYIQSLKEVLMDLIPLEAIGYIKRLSSISPQTSDKNEIIVESTIANKTEVIKVVLTSDMYIQAIEAHKNELKVRIKGFAKEGKAHYTIKKLESFEIINTTANNGYI